jgi:hypothetical protein
VASGTLIAESIRPGAKLGGLGLLVREIERVEPTDISPEQHEAGIPPQWTLVRFEVAEEHAEQLATELAAILGDFGWYADFHTDTETFVVFADRTFRYAVNDRQARREAEEYARAHGVPEAQIDWP